MGRVSENTIIAMEDLTVSLDSVGFEKDFKDGMVLNKGNSVCVSVWLSLEDGRTFECYLVPREGRPIELWGSR